MLEYKIVSVIKIRHPPNLSLSFPIEEPYRYRIYNWFLFCLTLFVPFFQEDILTTRTDGSTVQDARTAFSRRTVCCDTSNRTVIFTRPVSGAPTATMAPSTAPTSTSTLDGYTSRCLFSNRIEFIFIEEDAISMYNCKTRRRLSATMAEEIEDKIKKKMTKRRPSTARRNNLPAQKMR